MKKKFDFKKLFSKLMLILISIYVIITLVEQQKKINSYDSNIDYLCTTIEEKNEHKEELIATRDNINSPEYIESVAREKLNMYMPNEKVYIDIGS